MIIKEAIFRLEELDKKGIHVFSRADLAAELAVDAPRILANLLRILIKQQILERVARGVFVSQFNCSRRSYIIEEIACVLRRGHFNYVSLESILSEFGVISQIMISRITVMTTGVSGIFMTPYGIIEFTHTKRSLDSLQARTISVEGRPLLIATKQAGVADLKRVGRNVHMIDFDELHSLNFE
jgi:predicted transcriptional regulator of viral defense system